MSKSFLATMNPSARRTSLYSPLPGAFFKSDSSSSFHEIEDKLVWDKQSPLDRVRFDPSLSFGQRCIEMYKAIMGTHYIEPYYPSQKEKQPAPEDASLFSDFCQDDWDFYFIHDRMSLKNANLLFYMGQYTNVEYYQTEYANKLSDDTIYIQITQNKQLFYTVKSLNGNWIKSQIQASIAEKKTDNQRDFREKLYNEISLYGTKNKIGLEVAH